MQHPRADGDGAVRRDPAQDGVLVPATSAGRRFADELGTLNQRLADCCERVVLVVAGQPLWIKPAAVKETS